MQTTRAPARTPEQITETLEFEAIMRARVRAQVYQFVAGGARDERTMRRNERAFHWITLKPRGAPVPPAEVDPSVTLLGRQMRYPILVAPTSGQVDVHPDGERATYRAATRHGITVTVSQFGMPLARLAPEADGHFWAQMYPESQGSRVQEARAQRAEALVLTVDSPFQVDGGRIARWVRNEQTFRGALVETARHWVRVIRGDARKPTTPPSRYGLRPRYPTSPSRLVFDLASTAGMPVLVKGILAPEDAEIALEAGAAGIVVSNHGGRVLDGCAASMEMLPSIVERVAGRIPVLVDSGFRRGSDVLKARALGAAAVLVGRPILWGLGAFGEAGVHRVLEIFTTGLIQAMARCGARSMGEVDSRLVQMEFR